MMRSSPVCRMFVICTALVALVWVEVLVLSTHSNEEVLVLSTNSKESLRSNDDNATVTGGEESSKIILHLPEEEYEHYPPETSSSQRLRGKTNTQNGDGRTKLRQTWDQWVLSWRYYQNQWSWLCDKDYLQAKALEILQGLDELPKYRSYAIYIVGVAVWANTWISTIPLELAAGMVFGGSAIVLTTMGKTLGGCVAFGLGRHGCVAQWIQRKLACNTFLQLVEASAALSPLLTTVLICNCALPGTIKNFGPGVIKPIQWWMYICGIISHGLWFSCIWTIVGIDAALRLEDDVLPANRLAQTCLTIGILVPPLTTVIWLKRLKDQKARKNNELTI